MYTAEYLAGYKQALQDICNRANKILGLDRDAVIAMMLHTQSVNQPAMDSDPPPNIRPDVAELSMCGLFFDGREESPNPFGIVLEVHPDCTALDRETWIPSLHSFSVRPLAATETEAS
jgi:hypothetical protein